MTAEELLERASEREIREYLLLFQMQSDEKEERRPEESEEPDDETTPEAEREDLTDDEIDALVQAERHRISKLPKLNT